MASQMALELTSDVIDLIGADIVYVRLAAPTEERRYYLTGAEVGGALGLAAVIGFLKGVADGVGEKLGKPIGQKLGDKLAKLLGLRDELRKVDVDSVEDLKARVSLLEAQLDEVLDAYRTAQPLRSVSADERVVVRQTVTVEIKTELEAWGFPPAKAQQYAPQISEAISRRLDG